MAAKECNCGYPVGHAKAVSSAIFGCLANAGNDSEREDYWRNHADLLERKFTTGHGKHYSLYLD